MLDRADLITRRAGFSGDQIPDHDHHEHEPCSRLGTLRAAYITASWTTTAVRLQAAVYGCPGSPTSTSYALWCVGLLSIQSQVGLTAVPGSNPRMLEKSLSSKADCIAYDLEDAVAANQKSKARDLVADFLGREERAAGEVMVRINAVGTGFEEDDLRAVVRLSPMIHGH